MATFSSSPTEEIKSRLDMVEIVREYLPHLKQAGSNWKANCPFHAEKTPSFMISGEKQIWHCFGCGEGGDVFGFLMKIEGIEFPEALRILAQKAGVEIKYQDPKIVNQKTRLLDISLAAANYFQEILFKSPQAESAREYLKDRGVSQATIEDFKIGFSLDSWDALGKFLVQKGFREEEIFLAGLLVKKERGSGYYDRFRGRIMFPLTDFHGNTVGFSGRILIEKNPSTLPVQGRAVSASRETQAKYVNTPQTLIYNKSYLLYGLDKAKLEIRKKKLVVLVEGQMDVVSSHQAGVTNVVATSGTALTMEQIRLLKRYSENVAICFDTDLAGEAASERGIDLALAEGLNIRVIELREVKDPDECIKNNPANWQKAINESLSIMEYYFNKTLAKLDLTQVEDKKEAAKILLGAINKLTNPIEKTHWLQKLAELLKVPEDILRESLPTSRTQPSSYQENETPLPKPFGHLNRLKLLNESLLALALKFPQNLNYIIDHLKPELLIVDEARELYKKLIIYYTEKVSPLEKEGQNFDYSDFETSLKLEKDSLVFYAGKMFLLAQKDFSDFEPEDVQREILETIQSLKRDYIQTKLKKIREDLRGAEAREEKDKIIELSEEFNQFTNQLQKLE